MNRSTTTSALGGDRPQAAVIPFSRTAPRRFRRDTPEADAPRGRILLFMGVRYERMPETQAEAPVPQRKRS